MVHVWGGDTGALAGGEDPTACGVRLEWYCLMSNCAISFSTFHYRVRSTRSFPKYGIFGESFSVRIMNRTYLRPTLHSRHRDHSHIRPRGSLTAEGWSAHSPAQRLSYAAAGRPHSPRLRIPSRRVQPSNKKRTRPHGLRSMDVWVPGRGAPHCLLVLAGPARRLSPPPPPRPPAPPPRRRRQRRRRCGGAGRRACHAAGGETAPRGRR